MNKKLRILWNSNSPWTNSGYGVQSKKITDHMVKEGYPVGYVCNYGMEGGIFEKDGMTIFPKTGSAFGEDACVDHGNEFNADTVFTYLDIWSMNPLALQQIRRWIPCVFIDQDPPPEPTIERLRIAYRIVTVSKFGHDKLQKMGFYSTYIPCTVDTNIYKPLHDKENLRKAFGLPEDMYMFGMIAANKDYPTRKSYQEVIDAFALFHEKHPNSGIFFHINLLQGNAFNIEGYMKFKGLEKFAYKINSPYVTMFKMTLEMMTKLINTFDCLLAPSTNEGFGVPIIEAQSCEVPVITNNWTSMPELVRHKETAWIAESEKKYYTPQGSYVSIPSVKSLHDGMEYVFENRNLGKEGRKNVIEKYDTDTVFQDKWSPFLQRIETEIYGKRVDKIK